MPHPYGDINPFATPPPGVDYRNAVSASPGFHLELLARIKATFQEMRALASPPDDEVADVLGEVRAIEKLLGDWRRGLTVETPKVEGKAYRVTETREATRTYNTAAILVAAARGRSLDVVIRELIAANAAKLEFLWKPKAGGGLARYFADQGLELRIVGHAVVDDGSIDGPHVGEVWATKSSVDAAKQKED